MSVVSPSAGEAHHAHLSFCNISLSVILLPGMSEPPPSSDSTDPGLFPGCYSTPFRPTALMGRIIRRGMLIGTVSS